MCSRYSKRFNNGVYRSPAAEYDIISPWLSIRCIFGGYIVASSSKTTMKCAPKFQIKSQKNEPNALTNTQTLANKWFGIGFVWFDFQSLFPHLQAICSAISHSHFIYSFQFLCSLVCECMHVFATATSTMSTSTYGSEELHRNHRCLIRQLFQQSYQTDTTYTYKWTCVYVCILWKNTLACAIVFFAATIAAIVHFIHSLGISSPSSSYSIALIQKAKIIRIIVAVAIKLKKEKLLV